MGLYDPTSHGKRYRLAGEEETDRRYRIGKLMIEGTMAGVTNVTSIRITQAISANGLEPMQVSPRGPIDFGLAHTTGSARIVRDATGMTVTPLPDGDDCELELRVSEILGRDATARSLFVVDAAGIKGESVPFTTASGRLRFTARKGHFAYRVECQ